MDRVISNFVQQRKDNKIY